MTFTREQDAWLLATTISVMLTTEELVREYGPDAGGGSTADLLDDIIYRARQVTGIRPSLTTQEG